MLHRFAERLQSFAGLLETHERNQGAKNFVRPFEDQVDAGITYGLLIRILLGVADTASNLEGVVRRPVRELGSKHLTRRRLEGEVDATLVDHFRAEKDSSVQRVQLCGSLADLALNHLE